MRGRGWVKFEEEEEEREEAGHRPNQEAPGSLQVLLVILHIKIYLGSFGTGSTYAAVRSCVSHQ